MPPLVYDPQNNHENDLPMNIRVDNLHLNSLQPGHSYVIFICCQNSSAVIDIIHSFPHVIEIHVCAVHCREPDDTLWMADYKKVVKCDDPVTWVSLAHILISGSLNTPMQRHQKLQENRAAVYALKQLLDEPRVGTPESQSTSMSPEEGSEPDEDH